MSVYKYQDKYSDECDKLHTILINIIIGTSDTEKEFNKESFVIDCKKYNNGVNVYAFNFQYPHCRFVFDYKYDSVDGTIQSYHYAIYADNDMTFINGYHTETYMSEFHNMNIIIKWKKVDPIVYLLLMKLYNCHHEIYDRLKSFHQKINWKLIFV
jgi:hypothetical protein